jgi:multidrug resistance efflux pump
MTNTHPEFKSFTKVYRYHKKSRIHIWLTGFFLAALIIVFLPWTQNIRARGTVTTLRQEDRPQEINSIIAGRIAKWHIKEGDFVNAGDTILQLAEIKEAYLDPQLLDRIQEQLVAKQQSIEYYKNKAGATGFQINALQEALQLKLAQLQNKLRQVNLKIQSDSMDVIAAINDFKIATKQLNRQTAMYDSGLVSLTQLEQRNQYYQNAMAKKIGAENKLANTRQEYTFTQIEMNSARQEYTEKISKAEGERMQSLSEIASGQGEIAKLENQYTNYNIRSGMYYITAPQSGQVIKAKKAGIGEIVKESEMLLEIVPDKIQYAVEIFVKPVDLPLVSRGQKVRFLFDGFPAIVFSGWPEASYGTFGGIITAVESSTSTNGKFRVLVTEDKKDKPWPVELKIGTGVQALALLKNVPIWYELWRNINGFPPDYYKPVEDAKTK